MVNKNKNNTNTVTRIGQVATHAGLTVMIAATLVGMAEVAEREGRRVIATLQPSYAYAGERNNQLGHGDEQMRRGGREEIRHMSTSYDTIKRSNSISGTL